MAAPCLVLDGIHKAWGGFKALDGIDLSIERGEFVCFLGPSGCGKTTLLRIIAGLELQSAGTLVQDGRDISRLPPVQRDYGIVFQSYALFPNLTIGQNVAYGLVNGGGSREAIARRVDELLDRVGLSGSERKYPAQLSGGQQQRVALARALATSPGLLLLDEPLSALDAIVRVRLRNEIRDLQRQLGITTIMVTHDQEEALSVADRIVVMNRGRIEQVGTPMQVYREPATPFVADFIGQCNHLEAVAEGGGWYRSGGLRLPAGATTDHAPGTPVTLHLRPEDRRLEGPEGFDPATPGLCEGRVVGVEFLGGNCLASVRVDGLPEAAAPLLLQFSLNQMDEYEVQPGRWLRFALRTDRLRVFDRTAAAGSPAA